MKASGVVGFEETAAFCSKASYCSKTAKFRHSYVVGGIRNEYKHYPT